MAAAKRKESRYGMAIDLDRCTGCGACMVACAVENNVPPAHPAPPTATASRPIRVFQIDNGARVCPTGSRVHSDDVPAVRRTIRRACHVCPQQAVEIDPATGIVGQMPQRCLGCRYCMAACPYHARYFNWWDPAVARGDGEDAESGRGAAHARRGGEMQFLPRPLACRHGRAAAAAGRSRNRSGRLRAGLRRGVPGRRHRLRRSGTIRQRGRRRRRAARTPSACCERLGTEPKIYYRSNTAWVHQAGDARSQGGSPWLAP